MRLVDLKKNGQVEETTSESLWSPSTESHEPLVHKSYHELADFPVVEVDALSQLQNNIMVLEDLQARLSFMMREVRYLMKV
ncbi:hypothetical protein D3C87_253490 [compost metagenome]